MIRHELDELIKRLGQTYETLKSEGLASKKKPTGMFADDDELYLDIEAGLTISFYTETEVFEKLYITLSKTPSLHHVYKGQLPAPYEEAINQSAVHDLFGEPLYYSGPVKLPKPVGQTGGYEYYALDPKIYPNTRVQFQYLESMDVKTIVFSLIDKGHD
ncbi:DUF6392 family protein [Pseudomonas syringae]|uniref:Pyocin immunity protein n=1 Tax=Pseudomonas syringae TaxID=317 RepID=A0A085URZ5_PSESX|nr:DUF6392 family protein [Pseudomonas syringae]KFE45958.1 hypothetical protein IV02_26475 [Pseudomonas syringae]